MGAVKAPHERGEVRTAKIECSHRRDDLREIIVVGLNATKHLQQGIESDHCRVKKNTLMIVLRNAQHRRRSVCLLPPRYA